MGPKPSVRIEFTDVADDQMECDAGEGDELGIFWRQPILSDTCIGGVMDYEYLRIGGTELRRETLVE